MGILFMDAIELLLTRSSHSKLVAPAPSADKLEIILKAGVRAPDHANLSPYQFIVCQGEGLLKLSEMFQNAARTVNAPSELVEKAASLPFRAPMVIVGICRYVPHDKVPRVEQIATTACAMQNMQMAAFAQGYNGIWRTGTYAHCPIVRKSLGLNEQDEIIGYLYLGTPQTDTPIKREKPLAPYVSYWGE